MTHYSSGRDFEWRVRDALIADGYTLVMKAAASKGKVDLILSKPGELLYVQVKRTNGTIPPADRAELVRLAAMVGAVPLVAHRPFPRRPIAYRRLTGLGPKDWQPWAADVVGAA